MIDSDLTFKTITHFTRLSLLSFLSSRRHSITRQTVNTAPDQALECFHCSTNGTGQIWHSISCSQLRSDRLTIDVPLGRYSWPESTRRQFPHLPESSGIQIPITTLRIRFQSRKLINITLVSTARFFPSLLFSVRTP